MALNRDQRQKTDVTNLLLALKLGGRSQTIAPRGIPERGGDDIARFGKSIVIRVECKTVRLQGRTLSAVLADQTIERVVSELIRLRVSLAGDHVADGVMFDFDDAALTDPLQMPRGAVVEFA
jgi:hypothetical protein